MESYNHFRQSLMIANSLPPSPLPPVPSPSSHGGHPDSFSSYSWILGVVISVVGSTTTNFGMILQKQFQMSQGELPVYRWWIGLTFFLGGQMLNGLALAFASESLLAALGAFALVSNTILAPIMLNETLSPIHIVSTLLIMTGLAMIVFFSSHDTKNWDVTQINQRFLAPDFIVTVGFVVVVLVGIASRALYNRSQRTWRWKIHAGDLKDTPSYIGAFAFCVLAAIAGSFSILFSKCTALILRAQANPNDENQFKYITTYMVFFGLAVSAVSSVYYLNKGLNTRANALYIIPIFFVMNMIGQVLLGGIFFLDFDKLAWTHILMLFIGLFFYC